MLVAEQCPPLNIEGVHIGMPLEEFRTTYEGCYRTNDFLTDGQLGLVTYESCPHRDLGPGWHLDFARFYLGKLAYFRLERIGNHNLTHYQTIIDKFGLPQKGWEPGGETEFDSKEYDAGYRARLLCNRIEANVSTGETLDPKVFFPSIGVRDLENDAPSAVIQAATQAAAARKAEEDIKVSRFFRVGDDYAVAVVETTRAANVKCIVRDRQGSAIAVEEKEILPPAEEVTIYIGGGDVNTVECGALGIAGR